MSKDKELSADVKTVLHGEVLGPDEDMAPSRSDIKGQKATIIMDDPLFQDPETVQNRAHWEWMMRNQQQYNPCQNQYMGNMMGSHLSGFGQSFPIKTQYSHKKPWSLVDFLFGRN